MTADDEPGGSELATAYHEAGHAVMAVTLGRTVDKVTIVPGNSEFGEQRLGVCHIGQGRSRATKDWIEDEVLILMAGMIGESIVSGQFHLAAASSDQRAISKLIERRATNQKQFDRLKRRMFDKAQHILDSPICKTAIDDIVADLMSKKTISGRAVRHHYRMAQQAHQS